MMMTKIMTSYGHTPTKLKVLKYNQDNGKNEENSKQYKKGKSSNYVSMKRSILLSKL